MMQQSSQHIIFSFNWPYSAVSCLAKCIAAFVHLVTPNDVKIQSWKIQKDQL